jgi:hypothetical protein
MFQVLTCVRVLDLSYRFSIVIDIFPIEMFRSRYPVISVSFPSVFPVSDKIKQEQERFSGFPDRFQPYTPARRRRARPRDNAQRQEVLEAAELPLDPYRAHPVQSLPPCSRRPQDHARHGSRPPHLSASSSRVNCAEIDRMGPGWCAACPGSRSNLHLRGGRRRPSPWRGRTPTTSAVRAGGPGRRPAGSLRPPPARHARAEVDGARRGAVLIQSWRMMVQRKFKTGR